MPFDLRMKSWSSFKRIIYGLWGISQVVFFSLAYFIYEQEHSTPTSIQIGGLHRPPHQMLVTYSLLLRRKQITANKQVQVFFCRYNSIAHQFGNIKKKKDSVFIKFSKASLRAEKYVENQTKAFVVVYCMKKKRKSIFPIHFCSWSNW